MKPKMRAIIVLSVLGTALASPFSSTRNEQGENEASRDALGKEKGKEHSARSERSPIMDILWNPWNTRSYADPEDVQPPFNKHPFHFIPSQEHAQRLQEVQHYADMQMLPRDLFPVPREAAHSHQYHSPPLSKGENTGVNYPSNLPQPEEPVGNYNPIGDMGGTSGRGAHGKRKQHVQVQQQTHQLPQELTNLDDPYTDLLLLNPPQKSTYDDQDVYSNPYVDTAALSALLNPHSVVKKQPTLSNYTRPSYHVTPPKMQLPTYSPVEATNDHFYDYDDTYSQYHPSQHQISSYRPLPLPTTAEPYYNQELYQPTSPLLSYHKKPNRIPNKKRPTPPAPSPPSTYQPVDYEDPIFYVTDEYPTMTTPTPYSAPYPPYQEEELYTQHPYPIYKFESQLPKKDYGYEDNPDALQDLLDDGYTNPPPEAYDEVPYTTPSPYEEQYPSSPTYGEQYIATEHNYYEAGATETPEEAVDFPVEDNYYPTTEENPYLSEDEFYKLYIISTTPTPYYEEEVTEEPYVGGDRYVDLSRLMEQPHYMEKPYTLGPYQNMEVYSTTTEAPYRKLSPMITTTTPLPPPPISYLDPYAETPSASSPFYTNKIDKPVKSPSPTKTVNQYPATNSTTVFTGSLSSYPIHSLVTPPKPSQTTPVTTTTTTKKTPSPYIYIPPTFSIKEPVYQISTTTTTTTTPAPAKANSYQHSSLNKHPSKQPPYMSALKKAVALQQAQRRGGGGGYYYGGGYPSYHDYQYPLAPRTSSSEGVATDPRKTATDYYAALAHKNHPSQIVAYSYTPQQVGQSTAYQPRPLPYQYHPQVPIYVNPQPFEQVPISAYAYGQPEQEAVGIKVSRPVRKSVPVQRQPLIHRQLVRLIHN